MKIRSETLFKVNILYNDTNFTPSQPCVISEQAEHKKLAASIPCIVVTSESHPAVLSDGTSGHPSTCLPSVSPVVSGSMEPLVMDQVSNSQACNNTPNIIIPQHRIWKKTLLCPYLSSLIFLALFLFLLKCYITLVCRFWNCAFTRFRSVCMYMCDLQR